MIFNKTSALTTRLLRSASQVTQLPLLNRISPAANRIPTEEDMASYLRCQRLGIAAAKTVGAMLEPGWTEKQAATMMNTYLRDHGVQSFFHEAFVWFGDRCRFNGIKTYWDFIPTQRTLVENESVILDVAPILNGYVSDIGYTMFFGDQPNPEYTRSMDLLRKMRLQIPELFERAMSANATDVTVWDSVDRQIRDAGFLNVHALYPFSVLGHRVHNVPADNVHAKFIHFGWQSYWSLLSRGLFGQLLNHNFSGDLTGLWAVEPHLGLGSFGAKFEEILVVKPDGVRWLDPDSGLL